MINHSRPVRRGELWWESLGTGARRRPVVISSANWWNDKEPPLVAVVPISIDGSLRPRELHYTRRAKLIEPVGGILSPELMSTLRDVLQKTL